MLWTPDQPSFSVLLKRGELIDPARENRHVPYKLYYPADHEQETIPLIIWSHGFGGSRDGAAFLSRYLAGFGYALLHITHPGTDSSLWEGKSGHPWDILRATKIPRAVTLERFKDVSFVMDQLERNTALMPDNGPGIDFTNIGISGHSFGALTTQVIAGQRVPDTEGRLISMYDDRFKAGILYSPVPITHMTDAPHAEIYGAIKLPLLHMTGTDDVSPLEGFEYDHRLLVYDHTAHPEKYILIKEDGDHMVYNGTRGKLKDNPRRARHEDMIKALSLAFWDHQLKDDAAAHAWLTGDNVQSFLGPDGAFRHAHR